jgi:AcrR family transcriptional regulator
MVNEPKNHLTKEEWLERSLALLAQNKGNFSLDELMNKLGVTKRSFYSHFNSRNGFRP